MIENYFRTSRFPWRELESIDVGVLWWAELLGSGRVPLPGVQGVRLEVRGRRLRVGAYATAFVGKDEQRLLSRLRELAAENQVPFNVSSRTEARYF